MAAFFSRICAQPFFLCSSSILSHTQLIVLQHTTRLRWMRIVEFGAAHARSSLHISLRMSMTLF